MLTVKQISFMRRKHTLKLTSAQLTALCIAIREPEQIDTFEGLRRQLYAMHKKFNEVLNVRAHENCAVNESR